MVALIIRLAILSTLPLMVLLLCDAMPGINPAWDFANAAGFFCSLLLAALFIYSGRPLSQPHYEGKFFMNLHRDLGYAATLLLAIHIGVLLVSEPLVIDYLKPSASWTMLSGTLTTLLLVVLVPSSLPGVRKKIWRNHQHFRNWHYGLGAVMLAMMSVHVIGAGFYTRELWKSLLWAGIICAAICRPLFARPTPGRGNGARRRDTAIYASWLSVGIVLFALSLALGYSLLANIDLPL